MLLHSQGDINHKLQRKPQCTIIYEPNDKKLTGMKLLSHDANNKHITIYIKNQRDATWQYVYY
jgi:hypothetical protein